MPERVRPRRWLHRVPPGRAAVRRRRRDAVQRERRRHGPRRHLRRPARASPATSRPARASARAPTSACSYIGCDYYPTVTAAVRQLRRPSNPFAVAVANTAEQTGERHDHPRRQRRRHLDTVAAGDVKVITLPWVNELTQGSGPTKRRRRRLPPALDQAGHGVPVQPAQRGDQSTNDASLLLPVNTWTGNYLVASWQFWNDSACCPGFYAVVAAQDNTTVKLSAVGDRQGRPGRRRRRGRRHRQVVLNEGDVLEVLQRRRRRPDRHDRHRRQADPGDRRPRVHATSRSTSTACDHLEESMFPIETLAKEYIVVPPVQVPNDALEKAQIVRIIATEDNTTLTFTPDQPVGQDPRQRRRLRRDPDRRPPSSVVTADKKILVVAVHGRPGRPATAPATRRCCSPCRSDPVPQRATCSTPDRTGPANYVDIIAPDGATVTVDGAAVGGFAADRRHRLPLAHVKLSQRRRRQPHRHRRRRRRHQRLRRAQTTAATGTPAASTST